MKYPSLGPNNFCGVETTFEEAKAVIIPVPYDSATSYRSGAREGPRAAIAASRQLELYDLELDANIFEKLPIYTLDEVAISVDSPRKTIDNVRKTVENVLAAGKFPITLGGDHSIALGPFEAIKKKYPNVSVAHFYAHSDLRDEFDGSKYSHACVMHRIAELGPKVAQIGLRSTEESCQEYTEKNKARIKTFPASEKGKWKPSEVADHLSQEVYITFDVDCLDPSIMPSTGTPVPGGLMWSEALDVIREIGKKKKIVGFDVNELMPLPGFHAPDFLVANLIYKMLAYSHLNLFKK